MAPVRTAEGDTTRRLGAAHAISVFPFVDGAPGCFGQVLTGPERDLVVDMLAALHSATPPAVTPVARPELATRVALEEALGELGRRWRGGPFAEPARALMSDHVRGLRRWLAEFDRLVADLGRCGPRPVVTHGEPHPGNLVRSPGRLLLVDWDTVGLAVPERDLWWVATEVDLARYEQASGRVPDRSALALYRLRWALDDVALYVDSFRSPRSRTPDTELAWASLTGTVAQLTG